MAPVPPLPPGCGSWVIVRKGTLQPVLETFNALIVARINQASYEALTALDYLQRLNASLR